MERYLTYREVATQMSWSRSGLRHWVRRHNKRHPESPIRRLCGKICLTDFEAAIEAENQRYAARTSTTHPEVHQ